MTIDDRKEFENNKDKNIEELGKNPKLFKMSKEMIKELDNYDYTYLWSWLGLPIIQLPADIMATQEIIWETKPDIIIETGVARGGSLIFLAAMQKIIGDGRVIGIDIDLRKHNRSAIEEHILSERITMIEGSSTDQNTLDEVKSLVRPNEKVMVILDSDHSYKHVLNECILLSPLVSLGCYLVLADTIVGHFLEGEIAGKRSKNWFKGDEPLKARNVFLSKNKDFEIAPINGKLVLSSSPGGYLRRVRVSK